MTNDSDPVQCNYSNYESTTKLNELVVKMTLRMNLHAHNYTAIQVEFLQNTTTAREGTDVKLDIQYLLNPPNVTLQKPIIVTVMVVNGSATGKLQLSSTTCCTI